MSALLEEKLKRVELENRKLHEKLNELSEEKMKVLKLENRKLHETLDKLFLVVKELNTICGFTYSGDGKEGPPSIIDRIFSLEQKYFHQYSIPLDNDACKVFIAESLRQLLKDEYSVETKELCFKDLFEKDNLQNLEG